MHQTSEHTGVNVYVFGCAWHPLKHIPNCKRFSHNTCVNEAELSVETSTRSQVGNLLVCFSGEDTEFVLILMNNSGEISAHLRCSLQRLGQVTDDTDGAEK